MRTAHRRASLSRGYKFLTAKIVFLLISIPLLIILFELIRGPSIALAAVNVAKALTAPDFIGYFWANCFALTAILLAYLKPAMRMYCRDCRSGVGPDDARAAIKRLNKLHVVVIALSTLGFFMGDIRAFIESSPLGRPGDAEKHILFLKSLSKGLLSGTIISFNLENLLFPAKKAALDICPSIEVRKTSLYRRIAFIVAVLIFFIIAQISSVVSESFARIDESGNIVLSGSAIANYYGPVDTEPDSDDETDARESPRPRESMPSVESADGVSLPRLPPLPPRPPRPKRTPKIEEVISVLDLKILLYCVFVFLLLIQIKRMIQFPIDSMKNRLGTINSGDVSGIATIDIINNDEFASVLEEVNALIRKQQSELQCSSKRLESIVGQAADPIIAFGESGRIEVFNPAAERFFGYSPAEASEITILDLVELPSEAQSLCKDRSPERALIDYLYSGDVGIKRFVGKKKDGSPVQFESNVSAERSGDSMIYTAILRDVAKQVAAEDHLTQARLAAENANRLKTEFLANMSHELRTPLNAVLGFTQLLSADKNLTPGQLEKIGIISRSGEHLLSLINDILDISKIEAGKTDLHQTVFSPTRFVEDIHDMFSLRCKKAGLGFYVEYSGPLPDRVKGDLGKLRQVMINLVGNAVKFTQEGGIGILVGPDSGRIRFSVTDSGRGIPTGELESIMEPFVQSSMTDNEGGTGLGLAISSRYVRMMGGELSVESELGKGSTFSFSLDLAETDEEPRDEGELPAAIALKKGSEVTALIVDDKELNRLVLKEMLETAGFSTLEADNGKTACERAAEYGPDLVFMDIKMPVMDGYAAVRILKDDPATNAIPIFALTASAFTNDERRILEAGFDGYLAKPFKRADLFRLIREKSGVELEYETPLESNENGPMVMPETVDWTRAALSLGSEGMRSLSGFALINDFTAIAELSRRLEGKYPEFSRLLAYQARNFDENALAGTLDSLERAARDAANQVKD